MGRTHAKHLQIFIDNSGGTLTEITDYVNTVGSVGLSYEEQDTTAFSDGVRNVVIGQPSAPLSIGGPFDSVLHALMIAVNGVPTPLSFDIQVGLEAAWSGGDPQFGITDDGISGYVVVGYMPNLDTMTWTAELRPHGPLAPAWGTVAET